MERVSILINGFEIFFFKPGTGSGIASSRPTSPQLYIKLILNFNLI